MGKWLTAALLALASFACPLFSQPSQQAFESQLERYKTNKIILFGRWGAAERAAWESLLSAEALSPHGIILLHMDAFQNRADGPQIGIKSGDMRSFEQWMRSRYRINRDARWLGLGTDNAMFGAGAKPPSIDGLDAMLAEAGIMTPLRKQRDFLAGNPSHLDALADLLKEYRRQAILKMPAAATENKDLDAERDSSIWAAFALEIANVFNGPWIGIELNFFRPDADQPERRSQLMKTVFRENISKVETAVRTMPTEASLWNIWAWMANSLSDYDWGKFVGSFEPTIFPQSGASIPPGDVCVWIVKESLAKNDLPAVVKFAGIASAFTGYPSSQNAAWAPGAAPGNVQYERIDGYPITSAYKPYLEALLRLRNIDEANRIFDRMIRLEGPAVASAAASVAKAAGMNEISKLWERGRPLKNEPYYVLPPPYNRNANSFLIFSAAASDFSKRFSDMASRQTRVTQSVIVKKQDIETLRWKRNDKDRWALLSPDGRALAQQDVVPSLEAMNSILNRLNIRSDAELYKNYFSKHPSAHGIELLMAYELINQNIKNAANSRRSPGRPNSASNQAHWGDAVRHLNNVIVNFPEFLAYLPPISADGSSVGTPAMRVFSTRMLDCIEIMLYKKPSAKALWDQWSFWRDVEGDGRSVGQLIDQIAVSPGTQGQAPLPNRALDLYYEECIKTGAWPRAIALLKKIWEREFLAYSPTQDEKPGEKPEKRPPDPALGDRIGVPLIEAYLNDNKPNEANELFNAWLNSGGSFAAFARATELAKRLGMGGLAGEWESRLIPVIQGTR